MGSPHSVVSGYWKRPVIKACSIFFRSKAYCYEALFFWELSVMALSLQEAFSLVEDPRVERHKRHMLIDIIILSICAVISGADGWEAIEQFGKNKQDWLRKWIDLENGIPSHDCIARVIARITATEMTDCFIAWVSGVTELTNGEVVAIDGKTARHSYNRKDKLGAIHMVSAWANQAGMSRSGKNRGKI